MLSSLRMAVTPMHVQGSNEPIMKATACSSTLAGDPKRLRHCQDIRLVMIVFLKINVYGILNKLILVDLCRHNITPVIPDGLGRGVPILRAPYHGAGDTL